MTHIQRQIVATIGPASADREILKSLISAGMRVARLNFSWGTYDTHHDSIVNIRQVAQEMHVAIPIIQDLSGPRVQDAAGHHFDEEASLILTEKDLEDLKFGLKEEVDYVALSYVGGATHVQALRGEMEKLGKVVPIIAKIERQVALDNLDAIIDAADAVMVARGDLGNEVPLERIPFAEKRIIEACKKKGKPVIVATQILLSMTDNSMPTRAEMTDIAFAVIVGADALMLSEETANGNYPKEAVETMTRGISAAEAEIGTTKVNRL